MPSKKVRYLFKSPLKRMIVRSIDKIGDLYFRDSKPNLLDVSNVQNLLIIRLDHIGDFILTLPAVRELKRKHPSLKISLLCDCGLEPIAVASGLFERIHSTSNHWFKRSPALFSKMSTFFKLRKEISKQKYDMGIDFRGDFRNILLLAFCKIPIRIGYRNTGGGFLLQNEDDIDENQHQIQTNFNLLKSFSITHDSDIKSFSIDSYSDVPPRISNLPSKFIAIHSSAGEVDKIWSEKNFTSLSLQIKKKYPDFAIVLLGTNEDKINSTLKTNGELDFIDLRGSTSISDLFHLFKKASLFIGNDSGIGHIASTFDLPIITIFSDTNNPVRWKPWTKKLYLITGKISDIRVENVMNAVKEALNKC